MAFRTERLGETQVYSQQELDIRGYAGIYVENAGRHRFFPTETIAEFAVQLPSSSLQVVYNAPDGSLQTNTYRAAKINYQFVKTEHSRTK